MGTEKDNRDLSFLPIKNQSPKHLSFENIQQYNKDGFVAPFTAFSFEEITKVREN